MKLTNYLIFFGISILGACQNVSQNTEKESGIVDSTKIIIEQTNEERVVNNTLFELVNKAFEEGSPTHYTDSCKFHFECDCCSGEFLFNKDSSFYSLNYCMSDLSVSEGTYQIEGSILILSYSGICVSLDYNWENEVDSTAVDYFLKDTIYPYHQLKFEIEYCGNQLKLTESALVENTVALELKEAYQESIDDLEAIGIIQRVNILKENKKAADEEIKSLSVSEPTIFAVQLSGAELQRLKESNTEGDFETAMDDFMWYNAQLLDKADSLNVPVIYQERASLYISSNKNSFFVSKDSLGTPYSYIYFDGESYKVGDVFDMLGALE